MLKAYINCEILFALSFVNFFVISESNEDKNSLFEKHVSKRNDPDFQTCLESFDVYQDKIIRTQDSRDMGAKYLNERDVLSRDDCLKLCCETDNCDVFVFEEKSPGGCYLFECGSPEDFKCKFTKHQNYTSAVLKINRHLTELETQIKFTQHEHELTKLRQPPVNPNPMAVHFPTTESTKNQETINFGIERPPNQPAITKSRECSRYQFECHTSKECIAIYNACDGIPQCSDGSDEAPELGCPATPTPSPLVTTSNPSKPLPKAEQDVEVHKLDPVIKVTAEVQKKYPQQPYTGDNPSTGNAYATNPQLNVNLPSNVPNIRTSYGREGEGMTNFHPEQQWAYQYHPNQGGSQIFTHKGNGLVPQGDRYSQHQYIQQEIPQRGMIQQYGEQIPNDYAKYYYDNVPYRILPQNQPVNGWQMPHKNQEVVNQGLDESPLNRLENLPVANGPGSDYYYEEGYRNRPQSPQGYGQRTLITQNIHPHIENKVPETVMETNSNDMTAKHDVPKKKPPVVHTVETTTTTKPKEETPAHVSHRKVEKVSAEMKMKESLLDDEVDGHSSSPSGAVLSLTMGLCITGLMLIFVGCRMRVVKRRMRRGGKSPYAHDADFLVNGMYL